MGRGRGKGVLPLQNDELDPPKRTRQEHPRDHTPHVMCYGPYKSTGFTFYRAMQAYIAERGSVILIMSVYYVREP